jgi:hypothetical protein
MKVNVYTVGKNCIEYLPRFIDHYSQAFDDVTIYYFDNNSTDGSYEYAQQRGVVVDVFEEYGEHTLRDFKNTIWKSHPADWHIVCDVDELLQVTQDDIASLDDSVNVIRGEGWQVHFENPKLFFKSAFYDKCVMFKDSVVEINYSFGAHKVKPQDAVYSEKKYILKHLGYKTFEEGADLEQIRATTPANIHRLYTLYTTDRKYTWVVTYPREIVKFVTGNEKLIEL